MKKEKKSKNIEIFLDHLFYRIEVSFSSADFLNQRGHECATEYVENGYIKLHFREKPKDIHFPSVAHEVLHCIQFIAKDRGIDIIEEREHCAYMMQYILNRILKMHYELWK